MAKSGRGGADRQSVEIGGAQGARAVCIMRFCYFQRQMKGRIGYEKNRYNEFFPKVGGAKPD